MSFATLVFVFLAAAVLCAFPYGRRALLVVAAAAVAAVSLLVGLLVASATIFLPWREYPSGDDSAHLVLSKRNSGFDFSLRIELKHSGGVVMLHEDSRGWCTPVVLVEWSQDSRRVGVVARGPCAALTAGYDLARGARLSVDEADSLVRAGVVDRYGWTVPDEIALVDWLGDVGEYEGRRLASRQSRNDLARWGRKWGTVAAATAATFAVVAWLRRRRPMPLELSQERSKGAY